jgi:aldose sugar dehydrogenase
MDEIIFGTGFGCITDIVSGPEGYLYIVSLSDGTIYRIIPKTAMSFMSTYVGLYLPYIVAPIIIVSIFVYFKSRKKTSI